MPDVFRGAPFPPEKDGDKETLNKFFSSTLSFPVGCQKLTNSAKIEDRLADVQKFAAELKKKYKTVSILGYCWGELSSPVYRTTGEAAP